MHLFLISHNSVHQSLSDVEPPLGEVFETLERWFYLAQSDVCCWPLKEHRL